jgi:transposase
MDPSTPRPERFVAFDVHKRYLVVAAVDAQQQIVLPPRRIDRVALERWIAAHLQRSDSVVMEASTGVWKLYDQLTPRVGSVTVANPQQVKLITAAAVKTDGQDALKLARLLAAGLIPTVWVPPAHVRALRALVAHRERLVAERTQARKRLHALLHRHDLLPPAGELFAAHNRSWWESLPLEPMEKLLVQQNLALLMALDGLVADATKELVRQSVQEAWAGEVPYLVQLPGIGVVQAMTILAAIGDIGRFLGAKQLVGYAGLGARVHQSGQTRYGGPISKQGRSELRTALVEAAWRAVAHDPHWQRLFEPLRGRLGEQKAIVALARKLLVVVWHVLTQRVANRRADAEKVARKMCTWAVKLTAEHRRGLAITAFTRRELDRLRIGETLTSFQRHKNGAVFRLPPSEVVAGAG